MRPDASAPRDRLPSLTGARFVAAAVVFVNHAGLESVFRDDTVNFLLAGLTASAAEGAVAFFFMLSGFVLTWSVRPGRQPGRSGRAARAFWRRRLVKVFPNHVVTWLAGLLLMLAAGGAAGWPLIPSLLLVHAWFPNVRVIEGTDGPSWSLACELLFYLCFPVLHRLAARIRADRLRYWAAGLAAGIASVPFVALLLPYQPTLFGLPLPFWRFWFVVFLPPVRMLDFALGIVLARIVLAGRWAPVRPRLAVVLALAAWALAVAVPAPLGFVAPFVIPLALLLVVGATADAAGRPTVLGGRAMVVLGELSFAFYLVHWLVLHYGHAALGGGRWPAPLAVSFLAGAVLLALAVSWLLVRTVETPMMRRFAAGRRPAPDPPVGVAP